MKEVPNVRRQLTNEEARTFWMSQPWYDLSIVTFMMWWNNDGNKVAGGGFLGYLEEHLAEYGIERLPAVAQQNIYITIDIDRDKSVSTSECNQFFEKIWMIKEERDKLLTRESILPFKNLLTTNQTGKDLEIKFMQITSDPKKQKSKCGDSFTITPYGFPLFFVVFI